MEEVKTENHNHFHYVWLYICNEYYNVNPPDIFSIVNVVEKYITIFARPAVGL